MQKNNKNEFIHLRNDILLEYTLSSMHSPATVAFEDFSETSKQQFETVSASYSLEEVIINRHILCKKIDDVLKEFKGILPSKLNMRNEVRKLWMRGATNQEIALMLDTSVSTIKRLLISASLKRKAPVRQKKKGTKRPSEIERLTREHSIRSKLKFYTDLFTKELSREGFVFDPDELLSFLGVTVAEILQDYRPEKGAKLETFMDGCLKRRLDDFRKTLMRQKGLSRKKKEKQVEVQIYDLPENFLSLVSS